MPARAEFPEGSQEVLATLMQRAQTKAEFQRVQSVWLRATLGLPDEQIARAVGLSVNTVRCLCSRFRRHGVSALVGVGRGGRRHENLTVEQEKEFLQPFLAQVGSGAVLHVGSIKAAYEKEVGHAVPKSTIYRLLDRHGWRKLAPRPRHPKAANEQQEAFKKNSRRSSRKS